MKVLEARSVRRGRRARRWLAAAAVVVVVAGVAAGAYAVGRHRNQAPAGAGGTGTGAGGDGSGHHHTAVQLAVAGTSPAPGATGVASNATLAVAFNTPVTLGAVQPTLSPAVAGHWEQAGRKAIRFVPAAPFVPFTAETLTIPGGAGGMKALDGTALHANDVVGFTVADGSMLRLQELLASLGYLPLQFTPSGPPPAPADLALQQPGNFAWRWTTFPTDLTSLWTPAYEDVITKGAIMNFENQNGLTVDGLAGPSVWRAVLADVGTDKVNSQPYTYVLVSKTLPENLTAWVDGVAKFTGVPVNTGAPGADTADGTFEVFEHVTSSRMVGTNPDGSHYDDPNVPWASYFNGGDALHGFVRASYGSPQSNGCVEMSIADAGALWPYTPIGTLVTVVGPPS